MSDIIDTTREAVERLCTDLEEEHALWAKLSETLGEPMPADKDMLFRQAAATLTALLARCEKAEKAEDERTKQAADLVGQLDAIESERDDLRARCERLEMLADNACNEGVELRSELDLANQAIALGNEDIEEVRKHLAAAQAMVQSMRETFTEFYRALSVFVNTGEWPKAFDESPAQIQLRLATALAGSVQPSAPEGGKGGDAR